MVVTFFIEVIMVASTFKEALTVAVCFFILTLKVANFFKEALMVCEFVNLGCSN